MKRSTENFDASKFWVEDSVMDAWVGGGYMVRMEGSLKRSRRSGEMLEYANELLE